MTQRRRPLPGILACLCFSVLAVAAVARPPGKQDGEQGPPPAPDGVAAASRDLAEEMTKLFRRVEQNLKGIDKVLNDASAGAVALAEVEDSGLDDLLRRTQADSQMVVSDIDKILELARKHGGSCSKCLKPGNGECSKPGDGSKPGYGQPKDSPLDQARDGSPSAEEQTPDQPRPGDEPQEPGGGRPESPAESKDRGETRPGAVFEQEPGAPVAHVADSDPWGALPPKIQEIFRNEGTSDVPVQYRDWIDSYYKRLASSGR